MAKDWDATFGYWGVPPSKTEQDKCANSERAVRKAIAASDKLSRKAIEVFAQGSYANSTNVRQDSDVDICVLYTGAYYSDFSLTEGLNDEALGTTTAQYGYDEFKKDVEAALVSYFTRAAVRRGNKAFDIRENTYRIDADVVPCFEHRLFDGTVLTYSYRSGTQLFPDRGSKIVNWPKQNHENGIARNNQTGGNFKAITRILKTLRFELIEEGHKIAEKIPSYLIECLVYNVPVASLGYVTHRQNVRAALATLWNDTRTDDACQLWTEVNEVKYLFRFGQPWNRVDVHNFLQTAWNYIGYE